MRIIQGWLFGVFAACMVLSGCNDSKEKENLKDCETYVYTDSLSSTHVYGLVSDVDGNALPNVMVTSGQDTAFTSDNGAYALEKCRAVNGRCVVKFEGAEYFSVIRTADVADGEARVDALLMPQDSKEGVTEVARFSNNEGATIEVGKMKITIPANALVYEKDGSAFEGSVLASAYYLNPNSENFAKEMPGGDMSGVTADGKEVILLSYGMVEMTLQDSLGQKLQLKEGVESTLSFPVPEGFSDEQKYSEIPLWYFDEEKGTWIEEGMATKNGDAYTGNIKHFSWHNLDYPWSRASVCGRVTSKSGKPLPNVLVTISQTSAYSDKDGYYCAYVPQNTPVFVTVRPRDYAGYTNCPIYQVPGLAATTTHTQNVVLPDMPTIHGKVMDREGNGLSGIDVCAGKTTAVTSWGGDYYLYCNGFAPFTLTVAEYVTLDSKNSKSYEFSNPSAIVDSVSYDFVIDRPISIYGDVYNSNNTYIDKPVTVTAVVDNKEYKIRTTALGRYRFNVSNKVKEVTTYVKASDGYGMESNKVTRTMNNYRWRWMPDIKVPVGVCVHGYVVNTCGPSKATVSVVSGIGKNRKVYSQSTKNGFFRLYLPVNMKGKAKVKINCQGKRVTQKIEIDKADVALGATVVCTGEKPEPNCIYALVDDKTVKFDTKKDQHTELFQRVKGESYEKYPSYKYQAWYKSPDYNGFLVLEIKSEPGRQNRYDSRQLTVYLLSNGVTTEQYLGTVGSRKDSVYHFKTDCELYNYNDDDEIYLYGSADIQEKKIDDNIDRNYVPKKVFDEATKMVVGSSDSTKLYMFTFGSDVLKGFEDNLKNKGFKEKSTFMDDEQRVASIFLQKNGQALIHRPKNKVADVTLLMRDGIGDEPLYRCWKVDFKNSSLGKKGNNVDYMWKNEADIAQLVMFGPIMGVKFTPTTDEKCGCPIVKGETVVNK